MSRSQAGVPLVAGRRARVRLVEQGYRYFEMTIAVIEATLPLLEAGRQLTRAVIAPATPSHSDAEAYERARRAWEAREVHIESLRDDSVVSYLWVRSNDEARTFNPLRATGAYRR